MTEEQKLIKICEKILLFQNLIDFMLLEEPFFVANLLNRTYFRIFSIFSQWINEKYNKNWNFRPKISHFSIKKVWYLIIQHHNFIQKSHSKVNTHKKNIAERKLVFHKQKLFTLKIHSDKIFFSWIFYNFFATCKQADDSTAIVQANREKMR